MKGRASKVRARLSSLELWLCLGLVFQIEAYEQRCVESEGWKRGPRKFMPIEDGCHGRVRRQFPCSV